VDEHVFAAIVTDDEAETLLAVEELDYAGAFTDDLGGHAAATAAKAAATAAAAEAAATTTAAAAKTAAVAAEAAATTATEAVAAAEAAAVTAEATTIETTAKTAAITAIETIVAETVALVLAAPAAATSIKTHALLVTFASPQTEPDKHVGRMTCRIHRSHAVWDSLYQLFSATRMIFEAGGGPENGDFGAGWAPFVPRCGARQAAIAISSLSP
jgi:hypothetical protein